MLLGETPDDYDKYFILKANIDLDPNLLGRKVFDRAVIAPDVNDAVSPWGETHLTEQHLMAFSMVMATRFRI